ncbi:MAG: class I SAM-dependent methyltransferase [Lysobacter sp.]|nr:class I SAM-dependent methyltransferase [Lysobacter sp.]
MPTLPAPVLRCCLLLALAAPLIGACASTRENTAIEAEQAPAEDASLSAAISGDWRDPKNTVRDAYRHPQETLTFFGVNAKQTVVEITPGGSGWYSEILAPYLRDGGKYVAAQVDPAAVPEGRSRDNQLKTIDTLKARLAAHPAQFDRAQIAVFDPKQPVFATPGSADTVLTFRNVHNWVGAGTADAYFAAFFAALKPGGVLGVVDHRAKPGTDIEKMKASGYLTEQLVIDLATKAGFVLDARSEVNANPKDTADHPNGVWTLPPVNRHDAEDDAMYQAIGESDRMTLRFVKPTR